MKFLSYEADDEEDMEEPAAAACYQKATQRAYEEEKMMMVSDLDTPRFAVADLSTHYFARKSGKLEPFELEEEQVTLETQGCLS